MSDKNDNVGYGDFGDFGFGLNPGGYDGRYRSPFAQAYGSSFGQSGLGAFGAQAASWQNPLAQANAAAFAQQTGLAQAFGPRPRPIEDAGISAGEIIGHRAWRHFANGLLLSMALQACWAPDEPMFGRPDEGLGVHAFKTQSGVLTCYGEQSSPRLVVGTVLLWGTVIEHERGYRAEFGKVHSIDMICGVNWWRERRLLARIRRRYGLT